MKKAYESPVFDSHYVHMLTDVLTSSSASEIDNRGQDATEFTDYDFGGFEFDDPDF